MGISLEPRMTVNERVQKYKAFDIDYSTAHVMELVLVQQYGDPVENLILFQLDWFAAPQASLQEPGVA